MDNLPLDLRLRVDCRKAAGSDLEAVEAAFGTIVRNGGNGEWRKISPPRRRAALMPAVKAGEQPGSCLRARECLLRFAWVSEMTGGDSSTRRTARYGPGRPGGATGKTGDSQEFLIDQPGELRQNPSHLLSGTRNIHHKLAPLA